MLRFLLRLAPWLTVPCAVLAALAIGHLWFAPEFDIEANSFDAIPAVTPLAEPQELRLTLLRADGRPAAGGAVVMLEPELAVDYADVQGQVRLPHRIGGPVRLQAYAPGHDLLIVGPIEEQELDTLQLVERSQPVIPELAPERLVRHDVVFVDRRGQPVPGLLVLARRPLEAHSSIRPMIEPGLEPSRYEVPWIAFSETDGRARLEGLPELRVEVEAYPMDLPRIPAWRLLQRELSPRDGGETEWSLAVASLDLQGLPAGQLLRGSRTDVAGDLPMRRIPSDGRLRWPVLPPGDYLLEVDGVARELTLRSGAQSLIW